MNQMDIVNIAKPSSSKDWKSCEDLLSVGSSSPSFFKEGEDDDADVSLPDLVVEDSEGSSSTIDKLDGFSVTEITFVTNSTASTTLTCNVENPSAGSAKKRKPRDPPEQTSKAHHLKRAVVGADDNHNSVELSLERQRQARITLAKRKKEKILMLTRVLLNYLQRKDPEAYIRAVNVIQICAIHQKNRIKGFESLTVSIQRELRREVGEANWDCAKAFLENRIVKEAKADSSPVGKKSHYATLDMVDLENQLSSYGMTQKDIDNMGRNERITMLCHLSTKRK
mmetsp:Transcript_7770/g.11185  ORF Transcript_7770/g.11185 Transcript_7770/m.11185 type:complete len:282 (-) Transcript_7770:238-1083(-)